MLYSLSLQDKRQDMPNYFVCVSINRRDIIEIVHGTSPIRQIHCTIFGRLDEPER